MKELVQATNAENISLEALSLLCGAKLIAEAPTVGGWISVKDALPMLDEQVLIYAIGKIEPFIGKHVFALCNRYIQRVFPSAPGHIMWSSPWQYFHTDYEITHWQPMPEGPKEDE